MNCELCRRWADWVSGVWYHWYHRAEEWVEYSIYRDHIKVSHIEMIYTRRSRRIENLNKWERMEWSDLIWSDLTPGIVSYKKWLHSIRLHSIAFDSNQYVVLLTFCSVLSDLEGRRGDEASLSLSFLIVRPKDASTGTAGTGTMDIKRQIRNRALSGCRTIGWMGGVIRRWDTWSGSVPQFGRGLVVEC